MFQRAKYKTSQEKDWTSIPNPVAMLKRDGAHFFLSVDTEGKPHYFSRRESVKGGFPERTSQLPHLASIKLPQYAGHTYSVELIHTGLSKNSPESHPRSSGILNSLAPRAIQTQADTGPVRAVLIDVINPPLSTYKAKLLHMKELEKAVGKPDVLFVDTPAITFPDIVKLINKTKTEGREGVIITSLTEPEQNNTRIKVKHVDHYNLRVSKVIQEVDIRGTLKPSMGALEVVDATGRVVANVGSGFTKAEREEIWKDREKWIGELIQVKTMGLLKSEGRLRSPIFNGIADGDIDEVSAYG